MSDQLLHRRSIRKYSEEEVTDEILHTVLNEGCRASTSGNMQLYSIVATRNILKKKELLACHFNQRMVTEAPVVLTFCADFNRFKKWCHIRNAEPGFDNFLSFMTATIDSLLVAQTVCVSAESKGLGICYLGTTTYMAHKIIEVLNLPKGVIPVTTVTLGWPAEAPPQVDRLPLQAVLHSETYHDYTPEVIDDLYKDKEHRMDSQQFITENNKETLAQVFTDIRYKKADNEHFSGLFLKVLKDQGFLGE